MPMKIRDGGVTGDAAGAYIPPPLRVRFRTSITIVVDAVEVLMNRTSEHGRRGGWRGHCCKALGIEPDLIRWTGSFVSERQVVTEPACRRPYGDWAEAHESTRLRRKDGEHSSARGAGNFRRSKRGDETVTAELGVSRHLVSRQSPWRLSIFAWLLCLVWLCERVKLRMPKYLQCRRYLLCHLLTPRAYSGGKRRLSQSRWGPRKFPSTRKRPVARSVAGLPANAEGTLS